MFWGFITEKEVNKKFQNRSNFYHFWEKIEKKHDFIIVFFDPLFFQTESSQLPKKKSCRPFQLPKIITKKIYIKGIGIKIFHN